MISDQESDDGHSQPTLYTHRLPTQSNLMMISTPTKHTIRFHPQDGFHPPANPQD
jgi:hypothetical protein